MQYKPVKSYVLTIMHYFQAAITKAVVDHWRMIWHENAHTIVMVTNIKEDKKTKCQQYWPDRDSNEFGPFRITLADQQISLPTAQYDWIK